MSDLLDTLGTFPLVQYLDGPALPQVAGKGNVPSQFPRGSSYATTATTGNTTTPAIDAVSPTPRRDQPTTHTGAANLS
ncbi:MAG: hypothetical protein ACRDRP_02190 [Pseudonocardiaceae bacterium]